MNLESNPALSGMNESVHLCDCRICMVTGLPIEGRGNYILNANIINILKNLLTRADDQTRFFLICIEPKFISSRLIVRMANNIHMQMSYLYNIFKLRKHYDFIFFTMGYTKFFPILISKMLGKRIIYFVAGLAGKNTNFLIMRIIYEKSLLGLGGYLIPFVISNLEELNYRLCDILILESPNLINQIGSNNFYKKIVSNGSLYVNTNIFSPVVCIKDRDDIVCYFGTLSEHKGISNFIESMLLILKKENSIKFILGGVGPEYLRIKKQLAIILNECDPRIILTGKISHEKMPDYLNKPKLVVLPSYGEGLPNIILESMACGTPVLATSVGAIPDVIKDGETGFLLENNSPECIATNIIRAIKHPDLEGITQRARALIEREFTFDAAMARWRKILEESVISRGPI